MKRYLRTLLLNLRGSDVLRPITVWLVCFFASSAAVYYFERQTNPQFKDIFDGLWWTLITFTTTGYGDKVPITRGGQAVTYFTIFFGIGALAFMSGTMASAFVDRNSRARRGLMDFPDIKNHLIICGWKENMKQLLLEILRFNPQITCDGIVVMSNVDPEKIAQIREEPSLKHLKYIRGDYFSELTLKRANASAAKKIIVLADELESNSSAEVDSKTVLTVLTLKSMSKDLFVCAEILDKKFINYLKQAMCDEVIFGQDYNQMILANSTASDGISHVFYDLVSQPAKGTRLTTQRIPDTFIQKPFKDFREQFNKQSRMVLGVLENTGSPNKMRLSALREAQKTADVSRLISNLQEVKNLESNFPVLLPADEYVIPKYSMAIVLERKV